MDSFEDSEDFEVEELAQNFKSAVDNGTPIFFENLDMQDIIGFLLENDDLHYAKKGVEYALQTYPQDPYNHLLHSKLLTLQNKFDDAERILQYVEDNFAPIPELYIEKVLLAHIRNKEINSIELLQKSLEIAEDIPETHLLLVHEHLLQRQLQEAVTHAIRAIQLDKYAAEDLKSVLIDFPNLQQADCQLLVSFFKSLTEELPLCSSLWSALGLAYINANDFLQATEAFHFQLSIDDEDVLAYVNLAESYYGQKEYTQALEYFKIANQKCNILQFNIQIGKCHYHLHEYEKALESFLMARDEDPIYAAYVTSDIIRVFKAQGKFDEARAYLKNHLQKNPQDLIAMEELIGLLNPEKDAEAIKELCYTAINNMDSDLYQFFDFFVSYCYFNDCPDLGIELCENYYDDPSLAESINYHLALLYIKKGQLEKCLDFLNQAVIINHERLFQDFLEFDNDLRNIPEIALIEERFGGKYTFEQ